MGRAARGFGDSAMWHRRIGAIGVHDTGRLITFLNLTSFTVCAGSADALISHRPI